jgi:predicted Fe-Mo cluster-binding NifX family protein
MIAIPVMRARVAPVLNWCSRILLFAEDFEEGPEQELRLPDLAALERLQVLRQNGVNTLICGALSLELLYGAAHYGLKVISGVAGEVDKVLKAYREDRLEDPEFWLPGCRGSMRYRQGLRNAACLPHNKEPGGKDTMPGGRGGGQGGGQGRGQGRGSGAGRCGRGQGAGGGPLGPGTGQGAGVQDLCICPACGAKAPHERGIPCFQVKCPQCGKPMVRE